MASIVVEKRKTSQLTRRRTFLRLFFSEGYLKINLNILYRRERERDGGGGKCARGWESKRRRSVKLYRSKHSAYAP